MKYYKVFYLQNGKPTRFTVVMANNPQQAIDFVRGEFTGEMECEEL